MSTLSRSTSKPTAYSTVPTTEINSTNADCVEAPEETLDTEETLSSVVPQDTSLISSNNVHTEDLYLQTSGCQPGFAFCKFLPGIIETIIRVSIMV